MQRQRKASRKATIAQKQKQHFARARVQSQSGAETLASFRPSFIDSEHDSTNARLGRRHLEACPPPTRQTHLEDYHNTAPVVGRLSAMSARRRTVSKTHRLLPPESDSAHSTSISADPTVEVGRAWHSLPSESNDDESDPLQFNHRSEYAHSDLRRYYSNGRNCQEPEKLETQRRELLLKEDWAGLVRPKSFHLDFVSDRGKLAVGKRRKLNEDDIKRQEVVLHNRFRVPSIGEDYMMRGAIMCEDDNHVNEDYVRIRVGPDALKSHTDGMSQHQATRAGTRSSNDSMLFDHLNHAFDDALDPSGSRSVSTSTRSQRNVSSIQEHDLEGALVVPEAPPSGDLDSMEPLQIISTSAWSPPTRTTNQDAVAAGAEGQLESEKIWRRLLNVDSERQDQSPPLTGSTSQTKLGSHSKSTLFNTDSPGGRMQVSPLHPGQAASPGALENHEDPIPVDECMADEPKAAATEANDNDAAWKVFVFGSDDESDLYGLEEVDVETSEERVSMVAQASHLPASHRSKSRSNTSSPISIASGTMDRPSSVANASVTPAILHDKAAPSARTLFQVAQADAALKLEQGAATFHPPKRFVNPMEKNGALLRVGKKRGTAKKMLDAIEDGE